MHTHKRTHTRVLCSWDPYPEDGGLTECFWGRPACVQKERPLEYKAHFPVRHNKSDWVHKPGRLGTRDWCGPLLEDKSQEADSDLALRPVLFFRKWKWCQGTFTVNCNLFCMLLRREGNEGMGSTHNMMSPEWPEKSKVSTSVMLWVEVDLIRVSEEGDWTPVAQDTGWQNVYVHI